MKNTIPSIFKDPLLQKNFEEDGFVKIALLTKNDVEDLKTLFHTYFPNPSKDFFSSSYENDYFLKKEISEAIGKMMLPNLEKIFTNYTWFGSAFLSKGDGPRSEMPMHQDWTIVDETKYVALNIWTPLQNTTEENGTLEVIKGSHRWHQQLRAPTLPFFYDGFQNELKLQLTPLPTLATEAIVLNQAIIHYSKANKTKTTRIALTTGIKSKDAPMLFHYWNKNIPNEIEQFKQEDDFLIRFTEFHEAIFKRPVLGESSGMKPFHFLKPTQEEVERLTRAKQDAKTGLNKGIATKLMQWIRN